MMPLALVRRCATQTRALTTRAARVLLVQAHPVAESFSNAIADTVEGSLKTNGVAVQRFNLHQMPDGAAFSPLLSAAERMAYFNEGAQPQLEGDAHVKQLVAGLRWADSLVLAYPTWWFNVPSLLKGFFDRCFVPGVGFKYDHAAGRRTVGLTNIKRVGVVTTYGFDEPTVAKVGDAGKIMIQGGMSMLFHPECAQHWDALYSMQSTQSAADRAAFLDKLRVVYSSSF